MIDVLVIEDDKEIIDILSEYLPKYGMKVIGYTNPLSALESFKIDNYDIVILDLSLPDMDGLEVCKIISQKYNIPIIISTARSDVSDRVKGLELGADDYLPKPYDIRELVARIQSLLRRVKGLKANPQSSFSINEENMTISKDAEALDMTLAEYEILKLFLDKKQMVLSREYIANNVNSVRWESTDKSIDVIISRIRHKIKDSTKQPKYIKSIRGAGYKFIGE
ncbi:two-component response regulator [Sulfurimonas gotlandica GD1]|jgi:two-component system OmpR family response regulator|uniref:Two-component response regulator n=1 Tax=Sulfurimonas gotlandica (strain DSM 19862 / JCM 16533 / GD1) TaxID=929558 RepID=H1FY48_SULGG|nr:response regulator transcription factor [Sulfurimonas gotlandica]EHP30744.1 two-component response regulator [Sulfurimonas gotlandica GD1]